MKHQILWRLWAFCASFLLSMGVMGCFSQVYALALDWQTLLFLLALVTLTGVVLLPLRRGSEIALCLCMLALGYLLRLPETLTQLKSLLVLVSVRLNNTYHWGYFAFPGHKVGAIDIPALLYGAGVALAVSRSILRRRGSFIPMLLTVPVLLLCPLVPEAEPGLLPTAAVLLVWGMLLLTARARKNSALQGMKLTAAALVPMAVLTLGILLLNPQNTYHDRSADARQALLSHIRSSLSLKTDFSFVPQVSFEENLSSLSGGNRQRLPVLTFTAPQSGTVYLRGQDFDTYTGTAWRSDETRQESFDGWGASAGDIQIQTFTIQDLVYIPYYPGSGTLFTGGALANTGGVTGYSFPVFPHGSALSQEALSRYLSLPEDTRAWAEAFLKGITDPEEIKELVCSSALYDLDTPKMPNNEEDFVRWFLERSDRGFCVHFASAATVLLRAAGIPARYVVGFLQEAQAGKAAMVTGLNAHAWAEYYDMNAGCWKILEATASQTAETARPQTPQPAPTQAPSAAAAAASTETAPVKKALHLSPALWLLPGALLAILGRRELTLYLRRRRIQRADIRRRTLLYWRQAERLAKALDIDIPQPLFELAQEAKFSRHRLTPLDLEPLTAFCEDCRERLKKRPWWRRAVDRFWFVRY